MPRPAPAQSHRATPKPGIPSGTYSYGNDRARREDTALSPAGPPSAAEAEAPP